MQLSTRQHTIACFCALVVGLTGFQVAFGDDTQGRAAIRPSVAKVARGAKCAFRVILTQQWLRPSRVAESGVAWSVNGIPGGNDAVGTIGNDGVYHAPAKAPVPCEIHIGATVEGVTNPNVWATALIASDQPSYKQVSKWAEPADGSMHLKDPSDLALDPDGNYVITDAKQSKVYRYTADGKFVGEVGNGNGNTPGTFDNPRAVVVDKDGIVFVSDMRTGPPRIQAFGRDGKLMYGFAQKGIGPGQVMQTHGMAFDPQGRLIVADTDNMRVSVYAHDGTLQEMWQRNSSRIGDLNEPYGIVVDKNGEVFVPNYYGPCQKFTGKGEFLFAFAQPDPPNGPVAITNAAGDQWGNVYLAVRDTAGLVSNSVDPEPRPARILKFNNNGDLVATIPLWDDECSENAMVIDKNDRLHVLFKRANKTGVVVFEAR